MMTIEYYTVNKVFFFFLFCAVERKQSLRCKRNNIFQRKENNRIDKNAEKKIVKAITSVEM